MITCERLNELIKQGATIYGIDYGRCLMADMVEIKTKDIRYSASNDNFQYIYKQDGDCYLYEFYEKTLFETKEDAEFYSEFGNITRTETLELPNWEEFHGKTYYNKHYGIIFQGKASGCIYQMYEELTPENIIIYDADCQDIVFSKPPTKENYTLACRKCRELFLGKGE